MYSAPAPTRHFPERAREDVGFHDAKSAPILLPQKRKFVPSIPTVGRGACFMSY